MGLEGRLGAGPNGPAPAPAAETGVASEDEGAAPPAPGFAPMCCASSASYSCCSRRAMASSDSTTPGAPCRSGEKFQSVGHEGGQGVW